VAAAIVGRTLDTCEFRVGTNLVPHHEAEGRDDQHSERYGCDVPGPVPLALVRLGEEAALRGGGVALGPLMVLVGGASAALDRTLPLGFPGSPALRMWHLRVPFVAPSAGTLTVVVGADLTSVGS